MKEDVYQLLLSIPVLALIVEDFRKREVRLLLLVILFVCSTTVAGLRYGWMTVLINFAQNFLLLIYLSLGVLLYLKVKTREWINPLDSHIGWGDLIFMLAIMPLFEVRRYLIFLLASMVATLVCWVIYSKIRHRSDTIPLVGTLGISFIVYIIIDTLVL